MTAPLKILDGVDLNSQRAQNAADPTASNDLATKAYVDAAGASLSTKAPVVCVPTANITVSNPGTAVFDGITVTAGQRIALMNQTAGAENGLYQFNGAGSALTRTSDADTGAKLQGALFTINKGATFGDRMYYVTTDDITIGVTAIVFARFAPGSVYTASHGVVLSGSDFQASPSGTNVGVTVDASGIGVDHTKVPLLYSTTIGDGSSTSIDVTHNLGTKKVTYQIWDTATDRPVQLGNVTRFTNKLTLVFPAAPGVGAYDVVVHG